MKTFRPTKNTFIYRYKAEIYKAYTEYEHSTAYRLNLDALVDWTAYLTDDELKRLRAYNETLRGEVVTPND